MIIESIPVAYVRNGRKEATDDFWGDITSIIELAKDIPEKSLDGVEEFSHLEIIFYFSKADASKIVFSGHPRGNKNWPNVGIFAQRKKTGRIILGLRLWKWLKGKASN